MTEREEEHRRSAAADRPEAKQQKLDCITMSNASRRSMPLLCMAVVLSALLAALSDAVMVRTGFCRIRKLCDGQESRQSETKKGAVCGRELWGCDDELSFCDQRETDCVWHQQAWKGVPWDYLNKCLSRGTRPGHCWRTYATAPAGPSPDEFA